MDDRSPRLSIWQTDRIRLRAIEPGDWETFWAWNQDDEMVRSLDWLWFPQSREAVRILVEEASRKRPDNDTFDWVVENRDSEIVGSIGTHDCNRRCGTFGYGLQILPQYRRMGYASDAIRVVLQYAFDELGYQKATVGVYAFNEASIRLHERVGFQQEGRLRRMVFTRGGYFDLLMFGMTKEEFAGNSFNTDNELARK